MLITSVSGMYGITKEAAAIGVMAFVRSYVKANLIIPLEAMAFIAE